MNEAISNTSPLVYLHRIDALDWLPRLFATIWTPPAVVTELREGLVRGYNSLKGSSHGDASLRRLRSA
jgi:predicted nucleic acid-binding protein